LLKFFASKYSETLTSSEQDKFVVTVLTDVQCTVLSVIPSTLFPNVSFATVVENTDDSDLRSYWI